MVMTLLAIFFLLLLSAFFSGSETALTAASRPMMHQLEQTGDKRAGIVNRLLANKARFISAVLLGNNLVNILASALATSALIGLFGDSGVAYATVGMTVLVLIFAEILPKTFAFRYANRTALAMARVVSAVVLVLSPLTQGIMWLVRGIFRLFGTDIHGDEALGAGDEELRGAIELHSGDDDAIRQERAMLRSVLDLNDVQVGEIMVHRRNLVTIDVDCPPDELVRQVLSSPYTRIPLWRGKPENVVGVLHAKDLFQAVQAHGGAPAIEEIVAIAAKPWFVPEYAPLLDQLMAFRERREHFALVVDEYGDIMGVVTLEDILEEIVGEISDEHDVAVSGVRPQADGSYVVSGTATIRDLNREFEWSLPDEEATTVAGLVLHETQRIPEVGQSFLFHGFRFDILRRHRHQITQVRITPPAEQDQGA
ncbi:HlyC/CorC family transporter [Roseovarius pacificus]|uniref:HlyC/CorC family transporter n=1 Tax=Roseovarius pacificus TaxID=337701 RepID=UPI002A18B286|nr:HlyC/CorC family transporter [Roseovarius pacificus]